MSKPTAVMLPLILLVLDWWPLGRMQTRTFGKLVTEKLPWLVLATATSLLTLGAQAAANAIGSWSVFPAGRRLAVAAVAAATYLTKTVWPAGLSFFYPHPPAGFPPGMVIASILLLSMTAAVAVMARRRRPWLLAGLTWYLVALAPTLGLIQVGVQAMADRYTYLPLTGVFLAAAFSLPRKGRPARIAATAAVACLIVLAAVSRNRTEDWRDTLTLAHSALENHPDNWMAQAIVGRAALQRGEPALGLKHLQRAMELEPRDSRVWFEYGLALLDTGDPTGAAGAFDWATILDPANAQIRAFREHARRLANQPHPGTRP